MRTLVSAASLAAIALAAPAYAQELQPANYDPSAQRITVTGSIPADLEGLPAGPELEGFISARNGNRVQVTSPMGVNEQFNVSPATDIRARGGFLGLGRTRLDAGALMNGLPVTVRTVQWEGGLIASEVRFSSEDLETATMIRSGTEQQFAVQGAAIEENAAATEALRGRVANIDQYDIMGTANVYFDTGRWNITPAGQAELCRIAQQAENTDNALLLVVGYTDNTGDYEFNQTLSERRAGRVVNYLQQQCGWQPWRMLTPTGMAEADPAADNTTAAGRAQNRRVSVNILVSKAVSGM